ncbi:hypothetical protein LOK49_LG01G00198 [Camellia lanceoleosa]|uniref:Uncharacterized protein n=1 Tax=Camellia lanceoleosa TaxID=1840588 RepID=A0ACC0J6M1_9ERIC|nr:hypothetical protein LOK49_LG01G00198 [Camellia lanceoleosa]
MSKEAVGEYHSKDFKWDQLRREIESDPSLLCHFLLPLDLHDDDHTHLPSSSQSLSGSGSVSVSVSSPSQDSDAWNIFHSRHSGKFFKRRNLLKQFPELLSFDENSKVLEVDVVMAVPWGFA